MRRRRRGGRVQRQVEVLALHHLLDPLPDVRAARTRLDLFGTEIHMSHS